MASTMLACGGIEWVRSLNLNVRNRFLYDFLIYAGAGMWARYGVLGRAMGRRGDETEKTA